MHSFTRYLSLHSRNNGQFAVSISAASPFVLLQTALNDIGDLRYNPIFPAYLSPGQAPPTIPDPLKSVAFFFARFPYNALGRMKPDLAPGELEQVYFTQGLASILCLNCELSRALELRELMDNKLLEYWPLQDSIIHFDKVVIEHDAHGGTHTERIVLPAGLGPELEVYVEQIYASIVTLRQSYALYNPEELKTLDCVARLTDGLIAQYAEIKKRDTKDIEQALNDSKRCHAIVSALAELSASLSYLVTQGTSGCSPILANPSPFPHFSLLGVGGALRALRKFTRYLEFAFSVRDASEVIAHGYSCRSVDFPIRISVYTSGDEYKFSASDEEVEEEFDRGGDFPEKDDVPLLTYLSLRHGFKESKFAITAATEILTAEVSPQWTMMTLSHEIMHNRVRLIFQALFGASWKQDRNSILTGQHFTDFKDWYESRGSGKQYNLDCAIRNAILNFCCAMDRAMDIKKKRRTEDERNISEVDLEEAYGRHKLRAMELFVHFHDYYFAYARQPKLYTTSLWASWINVAAPYSRLIDYLVRTLATVACGTGLEYAQAFDNACEILDDSLRILERSGVHSPLFDKMRSLLKDEKVYAIFKPSYYLIDQVRRFFASSKIAKRIDRLEEDPFAEGSTSAKTYSANVFVYGEDDQKTFVSPIRFSLASLLRSMSGQSQIKDRQWLTAWNTMVISSQEANKC
jgi:hypothetical protein